MTNTNKYIIIPASLVGLTTTAGFALASTYVSADDVVDNVAITVPISCTMSGTGMNTHTKEVVNGTYEENIGTTTMKVLCNDNSGFSIYATGFTNEEIGETNSNKLVGTNASGNATIDTGIAKSGNTSNWAIKLATNSQATYPITITSDTEGPFSSYHTVPSTWTKVATRLAGTDIGAVAEGSTITSTYAAYISSTQPADTYTGKVKYTLVHPNDAPAPTPPSPVTPPTSCTTPVPNFTYMQDLTSANKASVLASMTEDAQYYLADKRDDKTYCVAKLRDGNIWMTQNLDLDIDSETTYTSADTDISSDWSPAASTHATGDTEWESYDEVDNPDGGDYYHPESYDPGDLYWNGTAAYYDNETDCVAGGGTWDSDNSMCNLIASSGDSHYHLGNYYNWSAAVATNDTSSYTTQYQDLDRSICPANWTLPKSGNNTSNGSFQYLVTQYGWDSDEHKMTNPNIWNTPIKSALAGSWSGSLGGVGSNGYFWSPVVFDSYSAHNLDADGDGYVAPVGTYGRYAGISVRCISR
ncbi:hypothetical protein IKF92_00480 [Candidatus Saccharibacteria bacterium]|nr:hypothetical protein [Candidatus Saccharibacteria bacterium]